MRFRFVPPPASQKRRKRRWLGEEEVGAKVCFLPLRTGLEARWEAGEGFTAARTSRTGWDRQRGLFRPATVCELRAFGDRSSWIEPTGELAIGIIAQLGGNDRPLPREKQELAIGAERANLIGSEQRATDMLPAFRRASRSSHGRDRQRAIGVGSIVQPE